jgi:signal peptidase I
LGQDGFSTAWPEAPAGTPPPRRSRFALARELPILIVVALSLALLIKTFLIQAFFIPSESMVPTLLVDDRVLVNKLAYRFREPRRGEIVVFITGNLASQKRSLFESVYKNVGESLGLIAPGDTDFIKRIIGLPGDTLQVRRDDATGKGSVYITPHGGKTFILPEPYLQDPTSLGDFGPFTVPDGRYFLMGDNRGNSSDSRTNNFGGICPTAPCSVPKNRLVGKAFVRIWPPRRVHVFQIPLYGGVAFGALGMRRRYARRRWIPTGRWSGRLQTPGSRRSPVSMRSAAALSQDRCMPAPSFLRRTRRSKASATRNC